MLFLHYSFPLKYLSPPSSSPFIIFIIFLFTLMMDPIWDSKHWYKNSLTVDSSIKDSKSTNHRSLKSNILSLYGGDTWSEILALESVRVRIKRRASDLHFLKNCRDNNLIPPFAQVKHRLHNKYNSKAFLHLSFSLIRSEIRRVRTSLEHLGRLALSSHLKLANSIDKALWAIIDGRTAMKAENEWQFAQAR